LGFINPPVLLFGSLAQRGGASGAIFQQKNMRAFRKGRTKVPAAGNEDALQKVWARELRRKIMKEDIGLVQRERDSSGVCVREAFCKK